MAPPKGYPLKDETGMRYGRLVVLRYAGNYKWSCVCDCGSFVAVLGPELRRDRVRSCGCLNNEVRSLTARKTFTKHGMSDSQAHRQWRGMLARCRNPNNHKFKDYGGRGIKVCERWLVFENYLSDMGLRPSPVHSIDRIDVDGDYEPSNCRWATPKEQAANKRKKP